MQAVAALAQSVCRSHTSALTYAGTKDKRGRTTQWACIRSRDPADIVRAAARLPNIHVGNFSFKAEPLKLGQLQGNRFRIALRQVSADNQTIESSLASFKERGFINYYGLQRFGNHAAVPTHHIGMALLRGQYKEACELILKPRENDIPFMTQIRECWWKTRDASQALGMFRNRSGARGIEQNLLTGLAKNGANDFVNSLEMVYKSKCYGSASNALHLLIHFSSIDPPKHASHVHSRLSIADLERNRIEARQRARFETPGR